MAYGIQASLGGVLFIFFVAWISGLLRGYVRLFIVKKFGLDDWLALGSLLLLIGPVACYCIGIDFYHLDRPITLQYGTHALAQAGAVIFFSEIFYIIGTGLIKISFGVTLLRFIQDKRQALVVKATIIGLAIFSILFFVIQLFGCTPVMYNWTRGEDPFYLASQGGIDPLRLGLEPKGTCSSVLQIRNWNYAHAAFMLTADMILGITVPILVIKNLKMKRSVKITTCSVLALGALASLATVIRLCYIHNLTDTANFYIAANPCLVWSYIEFSICILGANCSVLKPLARKIKLFPEESNQGSTPRARAFHSFRRPAKKNFDSSMGTSDMLETDKTKTDTNMTWTGDRRSIEDQMERGRGLVIPREPEMAAHGIGRPYGMPTHNTSRPVAMANHETGRTTAMPAYETGRTAAMPGHDAARAALSSAHSTSRPFVMPQSWYTAGERQLRK